jgi:septal ring factor EnvC (AmiA/AmiB activator)
MKSSLVFLVSCALLWATAAGAEPDAASAEVELDRVREEIQTLERAVKRSLADRGKSQRELQAAEVAVAAASKQLASLARDRKQAETRLAELRATETRTRARLASEQAVLAQQLRLAYMNGREEWLRLLLSQQDPAVAGRRLAYYSYLTRQRSGVIDTVRATAAELAATVAAVLAEGDRLKEMETEQRQRLAALEAARAERATALARLDQEIAGRKGTIASLRQQAQDLEALVEKLRQALAALPTSDAMPFAKQRGQLTWPASGRVRHRFGQRRADGGLRWEGTVLGTTAGSEVRAVYYGRVVFADWLNGMGMLVVLDHGDGYMTLYGYNRDLVCEAGEWVAPGAVLGHVGDSGGQADAGLYFEIRKDGKPIDPQRWMQ